MEQLLFNSTRSEWTRGDWIGLTQSHQTIPVEKPEPFPGLLLWIRKTPVGQFDANTSRFAYDLFTPELIPLQVQVGPFVCHRLYDYFRPAGCGLYRSVSAEILDGTGNVRFQAGFAAGAEGVAEAILFMRLLHDCDTWNDYDTLRDAVREIGCRMTDLDQWLARDLEGTGITPPGGTPRP